MTVTISPLDLLLDTQNPRFVILHSKEQADIRKYLLTFEDVNQLATAINDYGSLLPGERIVAIREEGRLIVVEGNRRACSLQLLLSRDLIPDGFGHKIPIASDNLVHNCQIIEVDVLPNRDAAIGLMSRRHIEGVKQWKPIAKKQFFASNWLAGRSVQNLSKITGIREGEIKEDIRDYKLFLSAYDVYRRYHPEFTGDIINLKIDPFWRIFKAKFVLPGNHTKVSPVEALKITYDDNFNTVSAMDEGIFNQIVQMVFEDSIITERVNTRNTLIDVEGILPLLESITHNSGVSGNPGTNAGDGNTGTSGTLGPNGRRNDTNVGGTPGSNTGGSDTGTGGTSGSNAGSNNINTGGTPGSNTGGSGTGAGGASGPSARSGNAGVGGPIPGGPEPVSFFGVISWRGKLDPTNANHQGLITPLYELYRFSIANCGRQKAYKVFPIAAGMILRTVYEQALRMRLIQVNLWGNYSRTLRNGAFPTLKGIEDFINQGINKATVLPQQAMVLAYDRVIAATHREFLNANIHYPGNIRVTSDSLEGIAAGGMLFLIQAIIDLA